jgi:hypothetical protein
MLPAARSRRRESERLAGFQSCPAKCRTVRAEMPALSLHNALTQHLVLSGEQILHEIVTTFIGIARSAGEMMIDSHARRSAEIIRNGKDFVGRFTLVEQPLRVRTRRADRKQVSDRTAPLRETNRVQAACSCARRN